MGFIIGYNGTERNREAGRIGGLKGGQKIKQYWLEQKQIYLQDPKLCFQCSTPIEYKKKNNKFCSHNCAAQYNNLQRGKCINKNATKKSRCIECNDEVIVNIRHSFKTIKCLKCKNIKCIHCGSKANFKLKNGNYICESNVARCPAIRKRNSAGQKLAYMHGRKKLVFNDEHRKKSNINKIYQAKLNAFGENVLKLTGIAKKYLYELRGKKCEICELDSWQGKGISFQIDHIDGNNRNNIRENLEALCPNCHSLTDTWRGRNKNNDIPFGQKRITDDVLLICLMKNNWNMRQSLLELNYAAKGGNYKRCHKLKREYEELIQSANEKI